MKNKIVIIVSVCLFICSCNSIPNKSVFEPLSTDELAKIINKDTVFADFYESVQKNVSELNEIDKAKFNDITYRKLYKVITYDSDTVKFKPYKEKWIAEWESKFGMYEEKVDSVLAYWLKYKQENSLDRFVSIEFAKLDKEYYSYSYDVKNVNMGFRLTPLQGAVEQIKFNYNYSAKINDIYGEKHRCISTTPFASTVIRYWEVEYSDEKRFKGTSTSEFIRDYDIAIEITDIRKDGVNYSIDDLKIPKSVSNVWNTDSLKYPYLHNSYREDVIKEVLCSDYKGKWSFVQDRYNELRKKKFPREFAFIEYLSSK